MANISKLGEKAYYALIAISLAVIGIFLYMTYLFYNTTKGTSAFKFTILIPMPALVALILLVLVLSAGKKQVAQELTDFFH